jgi:hypothetical protein
MSWEVLLVMGLVAVGLSLLISLVVAVQAQRRGYPLVAWLVAGALANPIFLLVLLGVMPDFRRKRLREEEMDDLEKRLRQVRPSARPAPRQRSLDEQSTDAAERSLGDEETRT